MVCPTKPGIVEGAIGTIRGVDEKIKELGRTQG